MKKCIEIALECLKQNRQERPDIKYIISSLNRIESMIGDRGLQVRNFLEQPAGGLPFHIEEEDWPVYKGNRPKIDTYSNTPAPKLRSKRTDDFVTQATKDDTLPHDPEPPLWLTKLQIFKKK